jgi:hypothetical protein
VSLFVKSAVNFSERSELCELNDPYECLFIELNDLTSKRNIIVSLIYRPPDFDKDAFITSLSQKLTKLKTENKRVFLMGDFNIDLLDQQDRHSDDFFDSILSNYMSPLITRPTRISADKNNLIDCIFCSTSLENECINGILYTDISDHYPIFTVFCSEQIGRDVNIREKRFVNDASLEEFRSSVETLYNETDVQAAFTKLYLIIKRSFDNAFPLKTVRRKQHKKHHSWLTASLRNCIKTRIKTNTNCE